MVINATHRINVSKFNYCDTWFAGKNSRESGKAWKNKKTQIGNDKFVKSIAKKYKSEQIQK